MNQVFRPSFRIALLAIACSFCLSLPAATISGTVTDRSSGSPAAGDTVTLLAASQNLQPVAQTTTDSQGRYQFQLPTGPHLIRVDHGKVSYYTAVAENASAADIAVYDALPSVPKIRIEAHVLHIEADPQTARIIETCIIQNTSTHTQLSPEGFDFVLPENAKPAGAYATDAAQVTETLTPVQRPKGRWSLIYPIRPGATQLEIDYSLPWGAAATGGFTFHIAQLLPTDNLAVMLPNGMHFTGSGFRTVQDNSGYQTFLKVNPGRGKTVDFSVSGTGSMTPPDQGGNGGAEQSPAAGGPEQDSGTAAAGANLLYHSKWIILPCLGLLLTVAAAFLLRRRRRPAAGLASFDPTRPFSPRSDAGREPNGARNRAGYATNRQPTGGTVLLKGLREEISLLEMDRTEHAISAEEYEEVKSALDLLLVRALAQNPNHDLVVR